MNYKVEKKIESENYEVDDFTVSIRVLDEKTVLLVKKRSKKRLVIVTIFRMGPLGILG